MHSFTSISSHVVRERTHIRRGVFAFGEEGLIYGDPRQGLRYNEFRGRAPVSASYLSKEYVQKGGGQKVATLVVMKAGKLNVQAGRGLDIEQQIFSCSACCSRPMNLVVEEMFGRPVTAPGPVSPLTCV